MGSSLEDIGLEEMGSKLTSKVENLLPLTGNYLKVAFENTRHVHTSSPFCSSVLTVDNMGVNQLSCSALGLLPTVIVIPNIVSTHSHMVHALPIIWHVLAKITEDKSNHKNPFHVTFPFGACTAYYLDCFILHYSKYIKS